MNLFSLTKWNGQRFIQVHSTYGIAHQSARRGRNSGRAIGSLRARDRLVPEQPADDAAQQPQSPGEDE